MGIKDLYADVHAFHRLFGHPAHFSPVLQPKDRVEARADWIEEEVRELREAKTIYDQADAYIDAIYFAVGGLVEMGVDPSELWRIVHAANMAKAFPDGSVKRREDGKIMKPPGWIDPAEQLEDEINIQVARGMTPLFDMRKEAAHVEDMLDGDVPSDDDVHTRLRDLYEGGYSGAARIQRGPSVLMTAPYGEKPHGTPKELGDLD